MTSHASRRPAHPGRSSSFYRIMSANTYNKRPLFFLISILYFGKEAICTVFSSHFGTKDLFLQQK